MANYYDDQAVKLQATFTDEDGAALDPTAVYCIVKDPSGNIASYQYGVDAELVKSDTGIYYVVVDADEVGVWFYRWYSTGTGQAAGEGRFDVETLTAWS